MPKRARPRLDEAGRTNLELLTALGAEVRRSRRRRHLTQRQLGARVGLSQATISAVELGHGGSHTLDTWQRIAFALGRPLRIELGRDPVEEPADAGHLAMQELVLRLARKAGWRSLPEFATRPSSPSRSADVLLCDDRRRILVDVETWNSFGDIGAGLRSFDRKLADLEEAAVARWGDRPARVAGAWIVRAAARNRGLVARYPVLFETRFAGSSLGWIRALTLGEDPPMSPGLVWCDVGTTRLLARRGRPGGTGGR